VADDASHLHVLDIGRDAPQDEVADHLHRSTARGAVELECRRNALAWIARHAVSSLLTLSRFICLEASWWRSWCGRSDPASSSTRLTRRIVRPRMIFSAQWSTRAVAISEVKAKTKHHAGPPDASRRPVRDIVRGMTSPPIRVLIELDPCADPIAGVLRQQPGEVSTPFRGWLSLTEALESIRCPGPHRDGESHLAGAEEDPRPSK